MISWCLWRRWNIYCPKYKVHHLFKKKLKEEFQSELFDYDEKFISPCSLHPINSGNPPGKYFHEIKFIGFLFEE